MREIYVSSPGDYLRVIYKHTRFNDGSALTACYLNIWGRPEDPNNGKVVAKGLAICSPKEPSFSKKIGRAIALGRALKAHENKKSSRPVKRPDISNMAFGVALALGCKSIYTLNNEKGNHAESEATG